MIKEDDLVLCTVKRIERDVVHLEIEPGIQATLSLPEIAAGRIRNIRDYVSVGKKIVCKVLRIIDGHPHLSLRRVTSGERQLILNRYTKERTLLSMLKTSVKDPEKTLEKIKASYQADEFLEEVKESPKIIEKFMTKEEASALSKILAEKKEKEKEVKLQFKLATQSSSGLEDIKSILPSSQEIHYLGASKFSITSRAKDFKQANNELQKALQDIQQKAKAKHAFFEIVK